MRGVIAHYKFNEDTAGDNDELVTNGDFSAWAADNPTGWNINESTPTTEISEVGAGEGHGGVGTEMCNLYTVDGTIVEMLQDMTLVVGRKYRISININTVTAGTLAVVNDTYVMWAQRNFSSGDEGIHTWTFLATNTDLRLTIKRGVVAECDITFDDVSIKLLAVRDSSGSNHHDGLAQQDTSVIHRAGRISGAFDFTSPDHIVIPDHDDFSPGDGTPGSGKPFSISAWVYMHSATDFIIASKGIYNGGDGEWLFEAGYAANLQFLAYDESIASCYIGRKTASIVAYENEWIHVVATYDGGDSNSSIKLYVNGVLSDVADVSNQTFVAIENHAAPVHIGRQATDYANGLIDNVMFFNRVLSAREIYRQSHLYRFSRGRSRDRVYSDYGSR